MTTPKAKKEYSTHPINDEYYTPSEAVEMILPYIPNHVIRIWECTAVPESNIVKILRQAGYSVIDTHINSGFDFLLHQPKDFDMVITNPPFSVKDKFLQRVFELKKPFMFLLPITALEGMKRHKLYKEFGIQLLIPDKRFIYKPCGSGAWFQTSWFTYGLNLEKDLNFISIKDSRALSVKVKTKSAPHQGIGDVFHLAA
jgi:hypothetical protein